ncbi:MAG: hypothetical protein E6Y49_17060, partial [Clostridium sporogenes]|nr:hypothetical protein [Clostridium sporogenes]
VWKRMKFKNFLNFKIFFCNSFEKIPGGKGANQAVADSFIGALNTKINSENIMLKSLLEAVKFGDEVSAIAVQRKGAQPSIPYLEVVESIYKEDQ